MLATPKKGQIWKNTKNGKAYEIIDIAMNANNSVRDVSWAVVYRNDQGVSFVRDMLEFIGFRKGEDGKDVYRFVKVEA